MFVFLGPSDETEADHGTQMDWNAFRRAKNGNWCVSLQKVDNQQITVVEGNGDDASDVVLKNFMSCAILVDAYFFHLWESKAKKSSTTVDGRDKDLASKWLRAVITGANPKYVLLFGVFAHEATAWFLSNKEPSTTAWHYRSRRCALVP